ncbi:MAG: multidrug efflux RND transporter permease subunit [Tunicatimonas sp.]
MISAFFVNRPVFSIVIAVVLTLVGAIALTTLPVSQYPVITPPVVSVSANFTGADAETVEETVTTPIEVEVNGTPGMDYITTYSTSSGNMSMNITFDIDTDVDIAALDVQNRVATAEPQLPLEVARLGVVTRKRSPSLFMVIGVYSPNGTHSTSYLDNYAKIFVRDRLLRVEGVGDLFARAEDFSMRVWLNPDRLAQYRLSTTDVVNALQEQNVQVSAGTVGVPPQRSGQPFEYTISVQGRLVEAAEFEEIIVRANPETGALVYLKDVARVELGKFNYSRQAAFLNGEPAAFLILRQEPNSNALETAERVFAAMKELKADFPPDVDYEVAFESVSVVQVSIAEVIETLLIALLLVVLVIFLFLQDWRATLIPVLAIPVSIIGTFTFFVLLGFSVNTLTLFGFVLAIGIVVDDAIVVVEAVKQLIDSEGLSPKEATITAMKDITAPIVATSLILAAVFLPVGFIPGIVGRLYQQFAITIAVSVLISTFLALSFTPALCAMLLKPKADEDQKSKKKNLLQRFFARFNQGFGFVVDRYRGGVKIGIAHTPVVLIVLLLFFGATVWLFTEKPTGFVPTEDEGRLFVTYQLPDAASTDRTLAVTDQAMEVLLSTPGVKSFAAIPGLIVLDFTQRSNTGTIFCNLEPWANRGADSLSAESLATKLQQRFGGIEEANFRVIAPPPIPGLGTSAGFSLVLQQRSTAAVDELAQVMNEFLEAINERPEVSAAFSFFTASTPGYQVKVDREKAKKLGVSLTEIFTTMQTLMGSRYVNDFTRYGRNFRVVAQADTAYRTEIGDLDGYYVRNQSGSMVPLSTFITYEITEKSPSISHFNLFRSAEVTGQIAPGYSSGQAIAAVEEVAAQTLPSGYGYAFSGLTREEVKSGNTAAYIFAISIVFSFLFLAALYESWSVPFAVLLTVPVAAFGAILTLTLIPSLSNNVYAQIGLITLIALSAKNAILIVEYAKDRLQEGQGLIEATINAIKLRLRPVVMTSMAFILGVLPLVFASGAGAVARRTLGWTVFGGMVAATLLAVFFVPVLYVAITRLAYGRKGLEKLRERNSEAA